MDGLLLWFSFSEPVILLFFFQEKQNIVSTYVPIFLFKMVSALTIFGLVVVIYF